MPTDTERLDWLEEHAKGYGVGWIWRESTTGRGTRLHETSQTDAYRTPREAIDAAMKGGVMPTEDEFGPVDLTNEEPDRVMPERDVPWDSLTWLSSIAGSHPQFASGANKTADEIRRLREQLTAAEAERDRDNCAALAEN